MQRRRVELQLGGIFRGEPPLPGDYFFFAEGRNAIAKSARPTGKGTFGGPPSPVAQHVDCRGKSLLRCSEKALEGALGETVILKSSGSATPMTTHPRGGENH